MLGKFVMVVKGHVHIFPVTGEGSVDFGAYHLVKGETLGVPVELVFVLVIIGVIPRVSYITWQIMLVQTSSTVCHGAPL